MIEMPNRVRSQPVRLFRADDQAEVDTSFHEPIYDQGHALKEHCRIAHQRMHEWNLSQQRRQVAGRRGKNGFRDQDWAGR
jgi:hypothetical protein